MDRQYAIEIINEIAQDIDATRGCPNCDRKIWANGYSYWRDVVDALGYAEACKILIEA